MLSKGQLRVVSDAQENLEGIAEYSFFTNFDVGLPGRLGTLLAEEGSMGQSRHIRPNVHFFYFWMEGCPYYVLFAGTTGYQHIIVVGTHKGIVLGFVLEIFYAHCEK